MNEHLKRFIGQFVTIKFTFVANGERHEEYVQGILREVNSNIIIDQYLTYYSLVNKEKDLPKITRMFSINEIDFISNFKI